MDEFGVADVLVGEQVCVLLGDVDGHPDAITFLFLRVVDGEFEPPRRENRVLVVVLVVVNGDAAVAEDRCSVSARGFLFDRTLPACCLVAE
nr:hypothetical protein [Haloquadratum walsbyi]